jgi:DNA-binding NarL/FixJ family response regulator
LLRGDPHTAALPILCITSDSSAIERRRAETAGATAILVKPCLPETLCEEVDRLVSGSESEELAPAVGQDRVILNRAFKRMKTTAPPDPPPELACPVCAKPLVHQHRHVGGVNAKNAEQWDYYACTSGCGRFQFRHRTRKLKRVT